MSLSSRSIQSLKQPAHRINFRIISATSSDNNYPATQLQLQSPESKGWQSQRFCSYPQIITIQLIDLAIIQKLTFLSHQSKISTKIDIQCKQQQTKPWQKLGYTCMQSNMTTNYQARQLRTVKLNKEIVKLFRFTFNPNYVNTINVFNQVGLIAISVYGQRYHPKPLDDIKQKGLLPPGSVLDKQTLDKLRELEYMKRDAIDKNDFQKASEIKQQIDKLKNGVQALAILEKKKKEAIRRQDYEEAKNIYQKMKKIRGPIPRVFLTSNDRYNEQNRSNQYQRGKQTFTPIVQSIKTKNNKSIVFDPQQPIKKPSQSPILQLKKGKILPEVNKSKIINVDDIVVGPNSNRNIFEDEQYLQQEEKYRSVPQSPKIKKKVQLKQQPKQKFNRNRINLEHKQPEYQVQQSQNYGNKLSPQCQQYFPVISELIFKNVFSNDKNLRQHSLDEILALVDKIQHEDYFQKLFINAIIFIVKNIIDDKIVSILLKVIDLLGVTFKQYKPKPEQIQRQNSKNIKYILQKLSEYIGHSNQKLKSQAQDVYIVLPKFSKTTSKQLCIEIITLNQKIDRAPRSIISKLEMLGRLIRKYDQQSLKSNNSSASDKKKQKYEDVIEYSKRFLQDRNNQVRGTAVKLLVYLGKIIGISELLKSLSDVKETTIRLIEEKLQNKNQSQQNNILPKSDKKILIRNQSPKNKINSPRIMSPKKSPPQKLQSPKLTANNKNSPSLQKSNQINNKSMVKQQKNKALKEQNQQNLEKYQPKNSEYVCQYCDLFDKRFENQNFRDVHYFKYCPLISICKECNQCVQVEFLNQHRVQQCEKKKYWKKCPRCKQSVTSKEFNQHVERKGCISSKPLNVANRCPHCHQDIEPKKKGWIKHLVEEGCPCQNDRAK